MAPARHGAELDALRGFGGLVRLSTTPAVTVAAAGDDERDEQRRAWPLSFGVRV